MAKVKVTVAIGFQNTALYINDVLVSGKAPLGGRRVECEVDEKVIERALAAKPKPKKESK
jgi:hypothetical protein